MNEDNGEIMYIGQYSHSMDPKNRLFIPPKFREKNKTLIITKGLEESLYLYSHEEWKKVLRKLEDLSVPNKMQQRAFKRVLLSGAHELILDKHGRVLIPQNLCDYAKIDTDVMIIGVGNRVELWNKSKWEKYYRSQANTYFKNLAGKLDL